MPYVTQLKSIRSPIKYIIPSLEMVSSNRGVILLKAPERIYEDILYDIRMVPFFKYLMENKHVILAATDHSTSRIERDLKSRLITFFVYEVASLCDAPGYPTAPKSILKSESYPFIVPLLMTDIQPHGTPVILHKDETRFMDDTYEFDSCRVGSITLDNDGRIEVHINVILPLNEERGLHVSVAPEIIRSSIKKACRMIQDNAKYLGK